MWTTFVQYFIFVLTVTVYAAPTSLSSIRSGNFRDLVRSVPSSCPLEGFDIPLPIGLVAAPNQQVTFAMVGRGTQNYTCSNGSFTSAGAVANLYDVSCLFTLTARFAPAHTLSQVLPNMALKGLPFPDTTGLPVALNHYFINTPGAANGISPVFASLTDRIVAKEDSGIDAVNPSVNVQYLKLSALEGLGNLAKTVYRVDTAGGQPGSACSPGSTKVVQYAAMYYFTS